MEIPGDSAAAPGRGLPSDLGRAVAARREQITASVMAAVMPALPAFGDPEEIPFASGLQLATETALDELASQIATGRRRDEPARASAASSLIARPKGARIFEEGSASDSCYLLTAGRAKVVMSGPNGAEMRSGSLKSS